MPSTSDNPVTSKVSSSDRRCLKLSGNVGFDTLPDQLVNKSVRSGFTFNIMCIGETGLGKSTLMDSLFNTSFESIPTDHSSQHVHLKANTYELEESNVRLKLTLCDTIGYGDQVNKEDSFNSIIEYIDQQFEAYLQEELKIRRNLSLCHDSRVHACLYFITPNGHGLKSIDLVCMKKLESKVNIIPIIAKADTINKEELALFKPKVLAELRENGVNVYQFPIDDCSNGGRSSEATKKANSVYPFAVVGSTDFVKVGSKTVRARQYPWGIVQVENESHCDFTHLREMLIRTNMEDLREQTHSRHYELYRKERLKQMGFMNDESKMGSFAEHYTLRKSNHVNSLQQKEEEMRLRFVQRVKEKESVLKEAERELHSKYESMRTELQEDKRRLDDDRRLLEEEISDFGRRKSHYEAEKAIASHHTMTLGKHGKKK